MFSISDAARGWVEDRLERDHSKLMKRRLEEIKKNRRQKTEPERKVKT